MTIFLSYFLNTIINFALEVAVDNRKRFVCGFNKGYYELQGIR